VSAHIFFEVIADELTDLGMGEERSSITAWAFSVRRISRAYAFVPESKAF